MYADTAKVCGKVWVVVHDPHGASEDVQHGSPSGLPLGLGVMNPALRILCHRLQKIYVRVLRWMSCQWLDP